MSGLNYNCFTVCFSYVDTGETLINLSYLIYIRKGGIHRTDIHIVLYCIVLYCIVLYCIMRPYTEGPCPCLSDPIQFKWSTVLRVCNDV